MFETVRAKSWITGHIRDLFRLRPVQLNPSTWSCVVRNDKVMVVHRHYTQPGDYEVMWCFLRPSEMPSRLKTNMSIRKHWPALKRAAIEGLERSQDEDPQESSREVRLRNVG